MSEAALFAFGTVVTVIAATGGWLFVYAHFFRPSYVEQNAGKGAAAEEGDFERVPGPR